MSRDALTIRVNQYRHIKLGNLASPAVDAEAIAQILDKHGHFTTSRRLLEVLKDGDAQVDPSGQVTRKQLRAAIALRLDDIKGDVLVLPAKATKAKPATQQLDIHPRLAVQIQETGSFRIYFHTLEFLEGL